MNPLQYRAGKVPGIERRGVLGRLLDWWCYPIDDEDAPFAPNACAVPVVPKHRHASRMTK